VRTARYCFHSAASASRDPLTDTCGPLAQTPKPADRTIFAAGTYISFSPFLVYWKDDHLQERGSTRY
jgi:hypothetical protein